MIRKQGWLAASLAVAVVGGFDRPARGSGIASSWSGASASTYYNSPTDSQQGATASASSSYQGSQTVFVLSSGAFVNVPTSTTLGATAGDDPAHLLGVAATSNSPNPGTVDPGQVSTASATASWSSDAVQVKTPTGSSLPNMIQLNFSLTFSVSGTSLFDHLTATFNGQTDQIWSQDGVYFSHYGSSVYSTTNIPSIPVYPGSVKDTFHIDLPVSSTGLSSPINLSLALQPQVGVLKNSPTNADVLGNLALTSVTLPDGVTTLASLGDSMSFASGPTPPNPVPAPEPASLLGWGLTLAVAGAAMARGRRLALRSA